jgi:transcription elongation factor GreA
VACGPGIAGASFFQEIVREMPGIPITARGAEKLKAELQRLKAVDRPAIIQAIKDAREKGDLSENAEYDAARERQGFIEGRIKELEGKLGSLQIIDPASVDSAGRIVFGATVELEDQSSGELVKYQIVGDDEADIKAGLISVSSPIARALIGRTEGDMAQVLAPAGKREYSIVSVVYE